MLSLNTTVVAVIAPGEAAPLDGLRAGNVRVVRADPDAPPLDRALAAWREASGTSAPYVVHDADPLAWVAEAWIRRFDGAGAAGELEVAVSETLARWRARSLDLPDYYLLVDPEGLGVTRRHWYLGVLGAAAAARVVPARPAVGLLDQLGALPPGPWWPDLDRLVADLDRVVPDQVGRLGPPGPDPAAVVRLD
ncbi:MAG: hypothetical protein AB7H43_03765 [Acidimicrobiia bacterium]